MLHIILLIWKNSKHYNTPARLVVLMREICNSLIIQACKYSSGEQIFTLIEQEDAAKAVDQLKTTLLVCGTFKSTYFDYKATANAECPANPWRIQVLFCLLVPFRLSYAVRKEHLGHYVLGSDGLEILDHGLDGF